MHVLVAYSRPNGKFTPYVFTVMIYLASQKETAEIKVYRRYTVYQCGHCGSWGTISIHETIRPSKQRKTGTLNFYRFDSVEPQDTIYMDLKDPNLLCWQQQSIHVGVERMLQDWWIHDNKEVSHSVSAPSTSELIYASNHRHFFRGEELTEPPYKVELLDWDEYDEQQSQKTGERRVEEELIRQTMNAEQIKITELLLEPKGQPLALEGNKHFIEAELRYVDGRH